jgi:hypothetical protein
MKTDAELTKLATDLLAGDVFTDRACRNALDIQIVFLPLGLMDAAQVEQFKANDPHMLYEYLDKALPRGVNGMPSFGSFQYLNRDEMARFVAIHTKLKAAAAEVQP